MITQPTSLRVGGMTRRIYGAAGAEKAVGLLMLHVSVTGLLSWAQTLSLAGAGPASDTSLGALQEAAMRDPWTLAEYFSTLAYWTVNSAVLDLVVRLLR
jgi:hypothetical protein